MSVLRIVDLCAGIGGIRKGFEITGDFVNVFSAEIDDNACITYEANFGENPKGDVTDPNICERIPKYDVLLAGFPCQAFSIAGKKEGFKDEVRGTIFFYIADIIERTRPRAFLLENVEGLVRHDKGRTFKTILNVLEKQLDYKVFWEVKNAKNFGVPQNRPRVYIVGFSNKHVDFEFPTTSERIYARTVNDILEENPVSPKYYLSEGYLNTLEKHKARHKKKGNGYGYVVLEPNGNSNAVLATGGSGKERNLVVDKRLDLDNAKVPTNKRSPLNKKYIRFLTPREWGRLQGFEYCFEGGFKIPVSDTNAYKQLGNAVAVPVIAEIAKKMKTVLFEVDTDDLKGIPNASLDKDNFCVRAI